MRVWIDIGAPDAARMHKAGKAAARVVVYTHKDPERVACSWAGEHIHRGAELELYLELYSVARPFLAELVARLKRRMVFALGTARARDRLTWPGPIFPGLATDTGCEPLPSRWPLRGRRDWIDAAIHVRIV